MLNHVASKSGDSTILSRSFSKADLLAVEAFVRFSALSAFGMRRTLVAQSRARSYFVFIRQLAGDTLAKDRSSRTPSVTDDLVRNPTAARIRLRRN